MHTFWKHSYKVGQNSVPFDNLISVFYKVYYNSNVFLDYVFERRSNHNLDNMG